MAGSTLGYSGDGSDFLEDAPLSFLFQWRIDFYHDAHFHPFMPDKNGVKSGSIVLPTSGETSANGCNPRALDRQRLGWPGSVNDRDVTPRKMNLTLDTNPRGLQVVLNGQPSTSPRTVQAVVGMRFAIGVPSPQTLGGVSYEFASWSRWSWPSTPSRFQEQPPHPMLRPSDR